MARQTASAVSGMSRSRTPRGARASSTAFAIAGVEPMVADSPIPLTPSAVRGDGLRVPLGVDVGAGEDAGDAGRPARGGDVDPPDLGVGVGAPDDGRVERPGKGKIRHVALTRGEESRIFLALERLADGGTHGRPRIARGPRPAGPRYSTRA